MSIFRKMMAFVKRDFRIRLSYKTSFILEWISALTTVTTFYFVSKLVSQNATTYLLEYQTGYFPFVLIGLVFSGYLNTALQSFSSNIRNEQLLGTLEAMLVSPIKIWLIVIGVSLWDFIFTTITAIISLLFGVLVFKVDLSQANLLAGLLILVMTVIAFSSIGIISAAFVIILKKGNPINWMIGTFTAFFGGVFFPFEMLPQSIRQVSYFLPMTYSLRGLRHAVLQGYSLRMLMPDIGMLILFCAVLVPLSLWIFKKSVDKAKITGSLTHY